MSTDTFILDIGTLIDGLVGYKDDLTYYRGTGRAVNYNREIIYYVKEAFPLLSMKKIFKNDKSLYQLASEVSDLTLDITIHLTNRRALTHSEAMKFIDQVIYELTLIRATAAHYRQTGDLIGRWPTNKRPRDDNEYDDEMPSKYHESAEAYWSAHENPRKRVWDEIEQ